jgi:hypothetical protein
MRTQRRPARTRWNRTSAPIEKEGRRRLGREIAIVIVAIQSVQRPGYSALVVLLLMGCIIGFFLGDLCNIFKGDCALDVFAGKDCLLFPFHEHLKVRWHGDHGSLVLPHGCV